MVCRPGPGTLWRLATIAALALALAAGPGAGPPARAAENKARTLKEQLSDKASDEQRVDDCNVPPERRGPVARPGCGEKQGAAPQDAAGPAAPPRD